MANSMLTDANEIKKDFKTTEEVIKKHIRENHTLYQISNIKSVQYLSLLAAVLASAIMISNYSTLGFVTGFLIIGIAQYHLSVAIHEASHFTLFRPRIANETIGHILCALLGFDLINFRQHHILHHKYYASELDPDWPEYQMDEPMSSRFAILLKLIRERCVFGAIQRLLRRTFQGNSAAKTLNSGRIRSFKSGNARRLFSLARIAGFQSIIFLVFWQTGSWFSYFTLWVLPLATIPMIFSGLRMFGEHGGLVRVVGQTLPEPLYARTCAWRPGDNFSILGYVEWLTLGAFNFDFHHEHHWFPNLPFHALPRIHTYLHQCGHFIKYPRCIAPSFADSLNRYLAKN